MSQCKIERFSLWLLLPIFLLFGAVPESAFAGRKAIKVTVMTFNIRYDEPRDGVNAWPNRKTKVADVIKASGADLFGVQEALIGQIRDIEILLPDFAWCGVGRTDGKEGGEFSAIFYRKSRFTLLETSTFWLSEQKTKPGSMSWDAAYPRVVTWARFRDKQARKNFFHFNTHFDHRGEVARLESAKLMLNEIRVISGKMPTIVTGDFNFIETAPAYKVLTASSQAALKDARYSSATPYFGPISTFNAFKDLLPDQKIDYIFVKNRVRVLKHGSIADRPGGLWPSDHLPVIAEVGF